MTVLTQPPSMGDVLKYEVNPNYTRDTITLLSGNAYTAGSVLKRTSLNGKYTFASEGGTDGAETAAAVLLYPVHATLADAIGNVDFWCPPACPRSSANCLTKRVIV